MNVTVSVFARFHAFYLAEQLHKRGHLQRLITTYPKWEVVKYGVPWAKIASLLSHELLTRGWRKLPRAIKPEVNLQHWFHERFDKAAWRHILEQTDLYVGWSSFSERGLHRARELGAVAIVERGSAHIEYQRDILQEEYERYGIQVALPHPAIVEKEKREYEFADYISIPSTFVKRTFLGKGFSEDKLLMTPYGVDLNHFRQLPKEDKIFRVIFVGGITLRKGVHYLLQAFAELNLPNTELWLVGSKTPEIEPFFAKYHGYFTYLGHKSQKKLHEFYSQSSVFVISSIEEGLAMVQPQAMACGLPLICTTNTGGDDLIDDGKEGFVIPIRDVEALQEKILYLYQNQDQCYEMGQNAKLKVQQGLSWDSYGDKIVRQYKDVVTKR